MFTNYLRYVCSNKHIHMLRNAVKIVHMHVFCCWVEPHEFRGCWIHSRACLFMFTSCVLLYTTYTRGPIHHGLLCCHVYCSLISPFCYANCSTDRIHHICYFLMPIPILLWYLLNLYMGMAVNAYPLKILMIIQLVCMCVYCSPTAHLHSNYDDCPDTHVPASPLHLHIWYALVHFYSCMCMKLPLFL